MEEKHWIEYLTGIGAIATPILVIIISGIGWKLRKKIDRTNELEDKLRKDRIEIYNTILEPFMLLLTTDAAWTSDKNNKNKDKTQIATSKLLSFEYRQMGFKLSLIANDGVVLAYNDLMQFFYNQNNETNPSTGNLKTMLVLLGKFLLQIRKSMGNETTKLNHWQMLEWFMADVKVYKNT